MVARIDRPRGCAAARLGSGGRWALRVLGAVQGPLPRTLARHVRARARCRRSRGAGAVSQPASRAARPVRSARDPARDRWPGRARCVHAPRGVPRAASPRDPGREHRGAGPDRVRGRHRVLSVVPAARCRGGSGPRARSPAHAARRRCARLQPVHGGRARSVLRRGDHQGWRGRTPREVDPEADRGPRGHRLARAPSRDADRARRHTRRCPVRRGDLHDRSDDARARRDPRSRSGRRSGARDRCRRDRRAPLAHRDLRGARARTGAVRDRRRGRDRGRARAVPRRDRAHDAPPRPRARHPPACPRRAQARDRGDRPGHADARRARPAVPRSAAASDRQDPRGLAR